MVWTWGKVKFRFGADLYVCFDEPWASVWSVWFSALYDALPGPVAFAHLATFTSASGPLAPQGPHGLAHLTPFDFRANHRHLVSTLPHVELTTFVVVALAVLIASLPDPSLAIGNLFLSFLMNVLLQTHRTSGKPTTPFTPLTVNGAWSLGTT